MTRYTFAQTNVRVDVMRRFSVRLLTALLVTMLLAIIGLPAFAQVETGEICVATFADVNADGQHDPDETALAGVNVNLVTGGVIIATHIVEENETDYCFENLLTGIYTVVFTDSPLYRATTAQEGTFAVEGQRFTVNPFGAFPIPAENLRAEVAQQNAKSDDPLDMPTRLMLATGGSMMVMVFMVGIGAVILGILSGRNPKRARQRREKSSQPFGAIMPPASVKPPEH